MIGIIYANPNITYVKEIDNSDNIDGLEEVINIEDESNIRDDIYSDLVYRVDEVVTETESPTVSEETKPMEIKETVPEETEPEKEKVLEYKYGRRMTPAIDINIPTGDDMRNHTDIVDTNNYQYLGTYNITGYTPKCAHCCGNTEGITASGVESIAGYTVATSSAIPFGTTLYIEGYGYYVVEDRGNISSNVIDIAAPSHKSCYDLTNYGVNVYIVPHEN